MFGRKKKRDDVQEALLKEFSSGMNELSSGLNGLNGRLDELSQNFDKLDTGLKEWEKTMRSQSDSLEDLLDTMEEQSKGETELEQRLSESSKREQALLDLVCLMRDQMEMIHRRLSDDAAWSGQFAMMERETGKLLRNAGIQETGIVGEPVDYEIHQVLEAVETDQINQNHTVACVYSHGRIYCGRTLSKAKVSAYRLKLES